MSKSIGIAALAAAGLMTGLSAGASAETIALVNYNQQALFFNQINDGATAAAEEAGAEFAAQVASETEEVRAWLVEEGGMARTDPDRTDFIAAAQGVQQEFAEKRGEDFITLVNAIQAAAQ